MCQNKKKDESCINEILKVICLLQNNSKKDDDCLDSCDRTFLGNLIPCQTLNTRPVMIYTCCGNGVPWVMPIEKNDHSGENSTRTSSVFRLEKIDNNCATFRVLVPKRPTPCNNAEPNEFCKTNSIFTMDLSCICAIRCLSDTFVEL